MWVITTVEAGSLEEIRHPGKYTSIALDSAGNVHISYSFELYRYYSNYWPSWQYSGLRLRYATNSSGSWEFSLPDSTGDDTGQYSSISIDNNDRAHISYYDSSNYHLKYANNSTGVWIAATVDTSTSVGKFTSIAADSNNNVHISYHDAQNGLLRYASNESGSWNIDFIDDGLGSYEYWF